MCERKLILTGFMGSGKSTVGTLIAEKLGFPFIDLDMEIVAAAGSTISEIFSRDGEIAFRILERKCLEQVLSRPNGCVVATGGGAVISDENRFLMRSHGFVANLNVSLEHVLARLAGCHDRPLLAVDDVGATALALLSEREQFYADADIRIDTNGKSVEDVAVEILSCFKGISSECACRKSC